MGFVGRAVSVALTLAAPRPVVSSRHPPALYVLATAELFERAAGSTFSVLSFLYFTEQHGFAVGHAAKLSGTCSALSYLAPVAGGLLADRVLGYRAALLLGTALLMAGYGVLSLDLPSLLYVALGLLILGQGLFRPSILAALSRLYAQEERQREAGFSRFYIAVNMGSALGPLIGSAAKVAAGWPGVFLCATFAVGVSFATLSGGLYRLPRGRGDWVTPSGGSVTLRSLRPVVLLLLVLVIYFIAYTQTTSTVLLFARDKTNRILVGHDVPVGFIAALPAIIVVTMAAPLNVLLRLLQTRRQLSTPTKMVCGLLLSALAFGVLAGAAWLSPGEQKAPLGALGLGIFILTVGELLVIPLGQSLIAELTPSSLTALTTGLWYGVLAAGIWFGGLIGALYEQRHEAVFFGGCAGLVLGAAVPSLPT